MNTKTVLTWRGDDVSARPWQTVLFDIVTRATRDADQMCDAIKCWRAYLFYKSATATEYGELVVVCENSEDPEGFQLADNQALNASMTRDQMRYRIDDICRRLPILPTSAR